MEIFLFTKSASKYEILPTITICEFNVLRRLSAYEAIQAFICTNHPLNDATPQIDMPAFSRCLFRQAPMARSFQWYSSTIQLHSQSESLDPVTLLPTHFNKVSFTINLLAVDLDPDAEYLTFNLASTTCLVNVNRGTELKQPQEARWIEVNFKLSEISATPGSKHVIHWSPPMKKQAPQALGKGNEGPRFAASTSTIEDVTQMKDDESEVSSTMAEMIMRRKLAGSYNDDALSVDTESSLQIFFRRMSTAEKKLSSVDALVFS